MTGDNAGSMVQLLDSRLSKSGMEVLGVFRPQSGELNFTGRYSHQIFGVMIASSGRRMWSVFRVCAQYCDGMSDPMNRWSKQVLEGVAGEFGARLTLPFERPYPPFQKWAKRATGIGQSPLGLLVHPRYGLWFALRGVLFFTVNAENQELNEMIQDRSDRLHVCDTCVEQPCLSACPVKAFDDAGLHVATCYSHLDAMAGTGADADCMMNGCAARGACPVGVEHKYCAEQLRFHMKAYR